MKSCPSFDEVPQISGAILSLPQKSLLHETKQSITITGTITTTATGFFLLCIQGSAGERLLVCLVSE